jgi:hypothetical protein
MVLYDNYSFNYEEHRMPIAYTPYLNAIELHNAVKLNNKVHGKGGAYTLDRPIKWTNF